MFLFGDLRSYDGRTLLLAQADLDPFDVLFSLRDQHFFKQVDALRDSADLQIQPLDPFISDLVVHS